jgi:NADH:ubiquinone oxidoreductase subunit C
MSETLLQQIDKLATEANTKSVQLRKSETIVEINQSHLKDFIKRLITETSARHLSTITGLDLGQNIGIIYHFWHERNMIHVKTFVPMEKAVALSIVDIIPGAILYEMEIHDMFGVEFIGNPWMDRKLLLPDTWPADLPPPLLKIAKPAEIRKRLGLEVEEK